MNIFKDSQIAKVLGIPVYIHSTLKIFWTLCIVKYIFVPDVQLHHVLFEVVFWPIVFSFVFLHEMAHSIIAMLCGINVKKINISFISGWTEMEQEVRNPILEIAITIVGPITNAILLLVTALIAKIFLPEGWVEQIDLNKEIPFLPKIFYFVMTINIAIIIFNIIPIFPLDGGRIMRAIFAMFMDWRWAGIYACTVTKFIAVIGGSYFLIMIFDPILLFISILVFVYGMYYQNKMYKELKK